MDNRILVVDDSRDERAFLSAAMCAAGFTVDEAVDGMDALQCVLRAPPSVVLCDIDMPRMNGLDFVTRLRRQPRGHELPVIFVSGWSATEHKTACLECGGDDYVTKPVDSAELVARVRAQLKRGVHRDALAALAQRDRLTGLANREGFSMALERELHRVRRTGAPLSLMTVHVDGLASINSSNGPLTGDAALVAVAQSLRELLRGYDLAARTSPTTFTAMLPETTFAQARIVAGRVAATAPKLVAIACQLRTLELDIRVTAVDDGMPNVEDILAQRTARSVRAEASGPHALPAMRGELSSLSLFAVLTMLDGERKTGILTVRHAGETGHVRLRDGQIVGAYFDGSHHRERNRAALVRMLTWSRGVFSFATADVAAADDDMADSTTALLMDCARTMDESLV